MTFLETFESRRDQCRALLELSREQEQLIAGGQYGDLLALLRRKQGILERIERQRRSHADVVSRWRLERDSLEADTRTTCERLLAETESILGDLVREEERSATQLVRRRDRTRAELTSVEHGSQVNTAYRDTLAPATHRHLDLDG